MHNLWYERGEVTSESPGYSLDASENDWAPPLNPACHWCSGRGIWGGKGWTSEPRSEDHSWSQTTCSPPIWIKNSGDQNVFISSSMSLYFTVDQLIHTVHQWEPGTDLRTSSLQFGLFSPAQSCSIPESCSSLWLRFSSLRLEGSNSRAEATTSQWLSERKLLESLQQKRGTAEVTLLENIFVHGWDVNSDQWAEHHSKVTVCVCHLLLLLCFMIYWLSWIKDNNKKIKETLKAIFCVHK